MEAIEDWCKTNKLMLNRNKTQYMVFSTGNSQAPDLSISLEGEVIARTRETKFLGCLVDDRLEAKQHVQELCKKINKAVQATKLLCNRIGYRHGKLLYNAYIHSHLLYCVGYWGMTSKTKLKRLHSLQRRALRAIVPNCNSSTLPEDLGILSLPHSLTYSTCNFLHAQFVGVGPRVLKSKFLGNQKVTRARNTRLVKLELRKTQVGRNSHYVKTAKIWNCLPEEIRTTESRVLFKKRLFSFLLHNKQERFRFF